MYFCNIAVQTAIAASNDDNDDEFYAMMISNIIISTYNREQVD